MERPETQFLVSLGANILIGIIGFYYQHRQLRAMIHADHRQPSLRYWPLLAMLLCATLAWVPWIIGKSTQGGYPPEMIHDYGVRPGFAFGMIVETKPLMEYKKDSKLLMIIRASYSTIDRMSDTLIEKSVEYNITGDPTNMAFTRENGTTKVEIIPRSKCRFRIYSRPSAENIKSRRHLLSRNH